MRNGIVAYLRRERRDKKRAGYAPVALPLADFCEIPTTEKGYDAVADREVLAGIAAAATDAQRPTRYGNLRLGFVEEESFGGF